MCVRLRAGRMNAACLCIGFREVSGAVFLPLLKRLMAGWSVREAKLLKVTTTAAEPLHLTRDPTTVPKARHQQLEKSNIAKAPIRYLNCSGRLGARGSDWGAQVYLSLRSWSSEFCALTVARGLSFSPSNSLGIPWKRRTRVAGRYGCTDMDGPSTICHET